MAKDKKVTAITDMEQDFAQWYTDIVKKAELIDYGSVRGCVILRPYGYAIWERIKAELDAQLKETGHENVYMPMFIPESLLQKEKDHIEGFAPEVAWVTHGGSEELTERLCIRPTSEVLFCEHYANIIQSHRDLPKLYNQWCSIVRWEKSTRPFLRTREFLWQEGHTAHATAEEAEKEAQDILDIYANLCQNILAMPVIKGQKTESEKFAGAQSTYAIESLMHDGKALQAGTTHYFGDGFARAFGIQYTDKQNKQAYAYQSSWGVSTRLIGGLIMTHSDNNGLVLPPKVAPVQLVIIPIAQHKAGVLEKAGELLGELKATARIKLDDTDHSPGWKFSEYEMKGVPLRLELGPKDIEQNQCVLVRRDTGEKVVASLDNICETVEKLLDEIQGSLLQKALSHRETKTSIARNLEEMEEILEKNQGFIKGMWCENPACEDKIKDKYAVTSRCIPYEQEKIGESCLCCGAPAQKMVIWGRAY